MVSLLQDNRKLLECDFMKDTIIECGGRVWKVHKLILATRSEWFNKALCGPFEEAKNSKVIIHEQDPKHVNWVITWIYSYEFYEADFTLELDIYENYLKFYHIADFFCLGDLREHIKKKLEATLEAKAKRALRFYILGKRRSNNTEAVTAEFAGFFIGVQAAYKFNYDWAKSAFVDFVARTHYWIFCNDTFRSQCKTIPEFHQNLLEGFLEVATKPPWSPEPPQQCFGCGVACEVDDDGLWDTVSVRPDGYYAWCRSCDRSCYE
ncbi:BTB/POZ protein [Hypoxylon sp. FL0890]|nr:BTB/POZ protein [Hypoxylon sp. FL0890]